MIMGKPTNGPYHWGNGPQPKRGGSGKSSGKQGGRIGAMAILLVVGPMLVAVALITYLAVGNLA